jgi:N-acetylmuramoyl-L-alanine amidase
LYREKKLVFSLGANYSTYFENDVFLIEDGKVNSVAASSTLYETTLTIETQTIFTYDLTETEDEMIITLLRPREKYDKIVVLDAGHGGTDNGASGNGLKEKVVNLNHAMAVYNLLQADSAIKVYMTRESDTYPTLQDRANLANEIDAHLFISIHNNSATSTAKGTETLYHPNSAKGKEMATILQQNLVNHLGTTNRGIKARTDLYVLKNTNMPAVLIEGAFLTNQEDAARMNTPTFIAEYGKAVYESILYFLE